MIGRAIGIGLMPLAAIGAQLDLSTLLIVAGAIVFSVATWRKDSRDVLRRQNVDLEDRNRTLEDERQRLRDENRRLAALPDLEKVYTLLQRHDDDARSRDERMIEALRETSAQLGAAAALMQSITTSAPEPEGAS